MSHSLIPAIRARPGAAGVPRRAPRPSNRVITSNRTRRACPRSSRGYRLFFEIPRRELGRTNCHRTLHSVPAHRRSGTAALVPTRDRFVTRTLLRDERQSLISAPVVTIVADTSSS